MDKKISIILPVYNSEKTIKRTINSVLSQTNENYELIIVNDGSKDNSGTICREYANKYPTTIKYIEIPNGGVSNARNIGLKNATGKYIMFIDADDEYYEETLQVVSDYIKEEVELIVFGYERIHTNTGKIKEMNTDIIYLSDDTKLNLFIEMLQKKYLFNQIWNKLYIKKILMENEIYFDINISSGEDYRFNLKYMDKIQKAVSIGKVLYKYYDSEDGLSLKTGPDKIYIKLSNLEEQKKLYERRNFPTNFIEKSYVNTCLSGITAMVEKTDSESTKKYLYDYTKNQEIDKTLRNIRKSKSNFMIKICIDILLIKNVFMLKTIASILIILRKIYRKIKLG